ncbi:hypothetical protein KI387_015403, partial [Taxus chinensis]
DRDPPPWPGRRLHDRYPVRMTAALSGRRLHDRRPIQGSGYTTTALKAAVTKPPPLLRAAVLHRMQKSLTFEIAL